MVGLANHYLLRRSLAIRGAMRRKGWFGTPVGNSNRLFIDSKRRTAITKSKFSDFGGNSSIDGGVAYVVWARSSSPGFPAIEPSRKVVDNSPALPHFLALGLTWYQSRRRQAAAARVDILLMRRNLLFYWHDACNQSPTAYEEYHRMSEQIIDRTT